MRNLIDLISKIELIESTGGIARRWIEVQSGQSVPFVHNQSKEEFNLVDLILLPPDPDLRYDDEPGGSSGIEICDLNIQNVIESLNPAPLSVTQVGDKAGRSAMIVVVQDNSGSKHVYVKKVRAKRSTGPNSIFWQTKEFATQTGLWAQTAQMKKAAIPIEPTDFIQAQVQYSISSLIPEVAKGLQQSTIIPDQMKTGLPILLTNLSRGSMDMVPGLAEFQPAIEIKLSELAVPLALATGNFMSGDYQKVEKDLLGPMGTSWDGVTAASFPAKAEKLIDAYVHFGSDKLDVSVKDSKGGGRPSTATIAETLRTYDFGRPFLNKNSDIISAIEILDADSAIQAPIKLAKQYGILNSDDIDYLLQIYGKGAAGASVEMTPGWKSLLGTVSYNPDSTHPEYQLGYHLLAICAKTVASTLNKDSERITDFFKTVLNKSNLIQVYAKTKTDKAGGLAYTGFQVTWPPVFSGRIEVDADSYTARTRPSRKISFSFNTSKIKDQYSDSAPKAALPNVITGKNVELRPKRTAKVEKPAGDAGLGRERR
jgi:hypothetical protein